MGKAKKTFPSDMIQMRMSCDLTCVFLIGSLVNHFRLIAFKPSLVFCFKTPKMMMFVHDGLRDETCLFSSLVKD